VVRRAPSTFSKQISYLDILQIIWKYIVCLPALRGLLRERNFYRFRILYNFPFLTIAFLIDVIFNFLSYSPNFLIDLLHLYIQLGLRDI